MNVETLRKEYEHLTPFEREALLVREAVGPKRDVEVDALGSRDMFEALWMSHWGNAFFTVASYAMFRAAWAERTGLLFLFYAEGEKEAEREEKAVSFAGGCLDASIGWLRALKRLEEESGAPFLDSAKMLDPTYAEELLKEDREIDDSKQYAALRELWDVQCSNVNREDAGRKLLPLPGK